MIDRRPLANVLTSPAYLRACRQAGAIATDARRLRLLVHDADRRFVTRDSLSVIGELHLDMACAVVEARAEQLEEGCPIVDTPCDIERMNLVIATLTYLTEEACADTCRDLDEHDLLAWTAQVVQRDLSTRGLLVKGAPTMPHWN